MKASRWRRSSALAAVALPVLLAACSPSDVDSSGGSEGEAGEVAVMPAPDFTLPDLAGNPVSLSSLRGKTVIIDFWATWCPPCVFQVPELNQFWNAHKDSGDVAVLGVAVDVEGREAVAPWAESENIQYTVLLGSESLARDYGAMGFPTMVVIAPDGTIDSVHVGLIEAPELEEIVAPLRSSGG